MNRDKKLHKLTKEKIIKLLIEYRIIKNKK